MAQPRTGQLAAEPRVLVAPSGQYFPSPPHFLTAGFCCSVQVRDALSLPLQSLATGSLGEAHGFDDTFTVIISFNFLVKLQFLIHAYYMCCKDAFYSFPFQVLELYGQGP